VVDFDDLFWIVETIIFIDRSRLELVVAERGTLPSLMAWQLTLESSAEGTMTLP
jgi:hypothetical protein